MEIPTWAVVTVALLGGGGIWGLVTFLLSRAARNADTTKTEREADIVGVKELSGALNDSVTREAAVRADFREIETALLERIAKLELQVETMRIRIETLKDEQDAALREVRVEYDRRIAEAQADFEKRLVRFENAQKLIEEADDKSMSAIETEEMTRTEDEGL